MKDDNLITALEEKVRALGFNFFGVIPAQPARRLAAYLEWIEQGYHGQMGYMARPDRISRRQDLEVILPGVQSILCVGLNYFPGKLPPAIAQDPSRGRISNYAWGVDYHEVMTPRLAELADWLRSQTDQPVESRVYVDTGAILERDHGETAVFGFTGKNTLLIHPRHGSFFFLGELLTTLPLAASTTPPAARHSPVPSCGSCRRCLDACPTNAFPRPYVLDARRCISYLTIELKEWIPRELRPLMGNWIYGCDICQEVCPFNRFAQLTHESQFTVTPSSRWQEADKMSALPGAASSGRQEADRLSALPGAVSSRRQEADRLSVLPGAASSGRQEADKMSALPHLDASGHAYDQMAPPLLDMLTLDEAGFRERFAHSPILRIKRRRLVRNACVAAGNWGSETAVPPLVSLLSDPEPLIRGHAAWALQQIDTREAKTAVAAALAVEKDTRVCEEMEAK